MREACSASPPARDDPDRRGARRAQEISREHEDGGVHRNRGNLKRRLYAAGIKQRRRRITRTP